MSMREGLAQHERLPAALEPHYIDVDELTREAPFVRAHRRGVPLRTFHVIDGDKCRLAAHRETHVARLEMLIDEMPTTAGR